MERTELLTQPVRVTARHRVKKLPEPGTMIHLSCMRKLMKNHIIHQMRRYQHEITGKADGTRRRTASPSGTGTGNPDLPV